MDKDSSKAASPKVTAKVASLRREALAPRPRSASASSSTQPTTPRSVPRAKAVAKNVGQNARVEELDGVLGGAEIEEARARPRTRLRQPDEPRAQMLERLSNPLISLHEASVLLQVCAATVRRLSNEGELAHKRTEGGQRRFHLSDVLRLSDEREKRRASSSRASARSHARPAASASLAPASARTREQERLEEVRAEQARVREGRERVAAMHARAQAARLAAQKQPDAPSVPTSRPGPAPASGEAARSPNPLRLGVARALAPRASADSPEALKSKPHEGDE